MRVFEYQDNTIRNIRNVFADELTNNRFVEDKTGARVLEIIGASFVTDDDHIFGAPNPGYIYRELEWYESQSLCVDDIPGGPPPIWKQVADSKGYINSNYGWCIWSQDNGRQYDHVVAELKKNPLSRRAVMLYTRPSMWGDYNLDGRSDFMCTNAVQYLIRDDFLHAQVQMRSNDAWAGYRNDYAWQAHVLEKLAKEIGVQPWPAMYWNAGSLHVYEKDFYLVDHYNKTGASHILKSEYQLRYPDSPFGDKK